MGFIESLHNAIDRFGIDSINCFKAIIGKKSIVSFDIFDTSIRRSVSSPHDVFCLVAKELNIDDSFGFQTIRIDAAKQAKKNALSLGNHEVSIQDIYRCMPFEIAGIKRKDILNKELDIELRICHADPVIKMVYDWCVESNKTIIFTSDTYFSKEFITRILGKCGYSVFDNLYISSEYEETKRSGKLFELMSNDYPISQIVHVGDNLLSDCIRALQNRVIAIKTPRIPNRTTFYKNHLLGGYKGKYNQLKLISNTLIDPFQSLYYKYGFECLGPVLAGASINMFKHMKNKHIDCVYFLARDGYLIKLVFDELFRDQSILSEYLYISRKSIQFPLLHRFDSLREYLLVNGDKKVWTYKMFCNRVGIDDGVAEENWKAKGLSLDYRFLAAELDEEHPVLRFFNDYKATVIANSINAENVLNDYLKQFNLKGNILLADTGGYGTTQKCFEAFSLWNKLDITLEGAYLWIFDNPNIEAFAFPYLEHTSHGGETQITELPLTAHEGSTEGYSIAGNTVVPVLSEYEYSNDEIIETAILEIQKGALDFAKSFASVIELDLLSADVSYENTKRISRHPTLKEASLFGNMFFLSDHQRNYLASPQSIFHYCFNINELKEDFVFSNWKIGFLKRLFKLPGPYYSIIKWSRIIVETMRRNK